MAGALPTLNAPATSVMRTLLIQVSPLALSTGIRTLVNVGDGPSSESFGIGGTSWQPALVKRPAGSLEVFSPEMDGTIEAGQMAMTISLKGLKTLAGAQSYYWLGAPITIYSTSNYDLSTANLEFVGNITDQDLDEDTLDLDITATVSTAFIEQPLLTKSFTGSGGINGDAGKAGTLLPAGFGSCHNIQPIMFDATNNIGMIDGYGNTTAITWLGEGLSSMGPAQADYPTYAALVAAIQNVTVKPGQWATCIAQGLIGLGAPPVGIITCHATFGANRPGAMMLQWISMIGASGLVAPVPAANIDTPAFNALDVACPYPVHFWTATQVDVSDLMKQMCASVNASPIVSFQGKVTVARAVTTTPVTTINRDGSTSPLVIDWKSVSSDPPYYSITARAARPASVLTLDQVNYGVTLNPRGGWNATTVYSNGDIVSLPDGSTYLYDAATPSSGNPVTNTSFFTQETPPTVVDFATAVVDKGGSTAKADLITEAANALAGANAANSAIAIIASDGYLAKGEKRDLITTVTSFTNERPIIEAQATALVVSSTTYENAYQALISYLGTLSPAWNDVTQDTAINSATFKGKFGDYLTARSMLTNALANAAAQTVAPTNRIIFSLMERGTLGWNLLGNPSGLATTMTSAQTGGLLNAPYFSVSITTTASNQGVAIGQQAGYAFKVTPGERLWAQLGIQIFGAATSGYAQITFLAANGSQVAPASVIYNGAATSSGFTLVSASIPTVPANAVMAFIQVGGVSSGSGTMVLAISQPMVTSVSPAQGGVMQFVAGPNAVPGADQTGINTAADTSNVAGTPSATVLANITAAGNLANTANATAAIGAQLSSDVSNTNVLTADEKKTVLNDLNNWNTSVPNLVAQANALSLLVQAANLSNQFASLKNYLTATTSGTPTNNTPPPNINATGSSSIDRPTYQNYFLNFNNALTTVATASDNYAQTLGQSAAIDLFTDPTFSRLTGAEWNGGFGWSTDSAVSVGGSGTEPRRIQFTSRSNQLNLNCSGQAVAAGQKIDTSFVYYRSSSATTGSLFIGLAFYDLNNNLISNVAAANAPASASVANAYTLITATAYAPANAVIVAPYIAMTATNGTWYLRSPSAVKQQIALTNIGANGRGLTSLLNSTSIVAGIKVVNNTGFVLSSTAVGTSSVTINIGAFTYTTDTGVTISYPAGTLTGNAFSTTYYVWRVDPLLNGGTSYGISTSLTAASAPGNLYLGYITTPSTSGTGGGGGGGGSQNCVLSTAWVATERGPVRARDVVVGDRVWCLTPDMAGRELVEVEANKPGSNFCLTIVSAGGARLPLAINTPMDKRDGSGSVLAMNAWTIDVASLIDEDIEWGSCTIEAMHDLQDVAELTIGGRMFFAGEESGLYIASHNAAAKP